LTFDGNIPFTSVFRIIELSIKQLNKIDLQVSYPLCQHHELRGKFTTAGAIEIAPMRSQNHAIRNILEQATLFYEASLRCLLIIAL